MVDEGLGPDHLSTRGLPSARRGYDKKAVTRLLREAADAWTALAERHAALSEEIEKAGGIDYLARDLGHIGADVGSILEAAREAAEGMRTRAVEDADRRQRESVEEAARVIAEAAKQAAEAVEEAESQAFEVRRGAWDTGTSLLEGAKNLAESMVIRAGEDVLIVRADAEREAHRRVAQARKEGDDIIRNARFETDRMVNQARQVADDLMESARKDSDAAQERTKALEGRRRDLLDEIDSARTDSIAGIKVLEPEPEKKKPHIDPDKPVSFGELDPSQADLSNALAAEVGRIGDEPAAVEPTRADDESEPGDGSVVEDVSDEAAVADDASDEPIDNGDEAMVVSPSVRVIPTTGGVHDLFERLRTTSEDEAVEVHPTGGVDPLEIRDRLVLPIYNLGLREVKRRIVDFQNLALDRLRTEGTWDPDPDGIKDEVVPALEPMVQKSAAAGVRAAATMAGGKAGKPDAGPRPSLTIDAMASDLAGQLRGALSEANGGGPREVASHVSRVFRAWRTDEGERWVRTVAYAAYNDSLATALSAMGVTEVTGVAANPTCEQCVAPTDATWVAGEEPDGNLLVPPASPQCSCTIAPAS